MSTTQAHDDVREEAEHHEEDHPTPREYVRVALALGAATALEVALSFVEVGPIFLPSLIILMVLKFLLVAGWFMHLRFDTGTYTRLMGAGLALALAVYGAVLLNLILHVTGT